MWEYTDEELIQRVRRRAGAFAVTEAQCDEAHAICFYDASYCWKEIEQESPKPKG
jgi:hypothetical protein